MKGLKNLAQIWANNVHILMDSLVTRNRSEIFIVIYWKPLTAATQLRGRVPTSGSELVWFGYEQKSILCPRCQRASDLRCATLDLPIDDDKYLAAVSGY